MAKLTRFEDLICWQKARELVNKIYMISSMGDLSKDFGLKDQLRRASISSMSNIAEGFSRYHKKEFIRFLDISQSSATEVKSLLYSVLDQQYLDSDSIQTLQNDSDEVRALTMGLLKYVNRSKAIDKISEPITEYGSSKKTWSLPGKFVNT